MIRTLPPYVRLTVLLLLFWCCGISPLYAQVDEARTDTLTQQVMQRRNRKTATGRVKERQTERPAEPILAPDDSIMPHQGDSIQQTIVVTDSAGIDSLSSLPVISPIDSASIAAAVDSVTKLTWAQRKALFVPDPIRATWLALVIPGGGQIYNRKYWKLPIVYGGVFGCIYALTWNNQMLRDYQQAYLDIMDSDPNTCSYMKMLPIGYNIEGKEDRFKEIFKNKKNFYRKYRDLSIFAFVGVYLISVIDAYVDAELSTFDISPDLSLHWAPTFMETDFTSTRHHRNIPALQLSLAF